MGVFVLTAAEWIALAACVGMLSALISSVSKAVYTRELNNHTEQISKASEANIPSADPHEREQQRSLNGFGRALVLTAYAVVIGVIEVALFSAVASIYGVEVNVSTMPMNWLVAFYALGLVPGLLLLMAFASLTTMFEA